MIDELRRRWRADLQLCDTSADQLDRVFADIAQHYGEPVRRYHTLDHVASVLGTIDGLVAAGLVDDALAVVLAGWLHDVVYDPTRSDNEGASARYAETVLPSLGVPAADIVETARLIELTAGHAVVDHDRNGAALADADLAVLGSEPEDYGRYAEGIRAEYGHVPDEAFRVGRAAVLEGFLVRPRLYVTDVMHERLDGPARANLRDELARLGGSAPR